MGKGHALAAFRESRKARALTKQCVAQMAAIEKRKPLSFRDKKKATILSGLKALKAPAVTQRNHPFCQLYPSSLFGFASTIFLGRWPPKSDPCKFNWCSGDIMGGAYAVGVRFGGHPKQEYVDIESNENIYIYIMLEANVKRAS